MYSDDDDSISDGEEEELEEELDAFMQSKKNLIIESARRKF